MAAPWGQREAFVRDNVHGDRAIARLPLPTQVCGGSFTSRRRASIRRFEHQVNVPEAFTPPARWPTPYGETKWLSEQRVLDPRFASMEPVVLRPRAVFGEGDRAIVPRVLAVARRAGRFPLIDGGSALIDVTVCRQRRVGRRAGLAHAARALRTGLQHHQRRADDGARVARPKLFGALGVEGSLRADCPGPSRSSVGAAVEKHCAAHPPGGGEPRLTRYGIALLAYSMTLDISAARRTPRLQAASSR